MLAELLSLKVPPTCTNINIALRFFVTSNVSYYFTGFLFILPPVLLRGKGSRVDALLS